MDELVAEWVAKAEGDFATAGRELRTRRLPNYDAVCFHAQQMAEKYLKAFLQQRRLAPPRTHSLIELLELCLPADASMGILRDSLVRLERYAVSYRYPGESADREEARLAFGTAEGVREFLRGKLGVTATYAK
jgi:HEPN domain-containing protein